MHAESHFRPFDEVSVEHSTRTRQLLFASPFLIAACTLSLFRSPLSLSTPSAAGATAAPAAETSEVPNASATPLVEDKPIPTTPAGELEFCADPGPLKLLDAFEAAILSADGQALAAAVSPQHGMDARLLRDGRVVNYDRAHAAALFDSTYVVDWGIAPGSGLPVKGSFREVFVPDLLDVLSRQYSQRCNQLEVGGTTYEAGWPYAGIDFFSLYYAGSAEYGSMDWHTWVIGIQTLDDLPYVYAMMQFKWEP